MGNIYNFDNNLSINLSDFIQKINDNFFNLQHLYSTKFANTQSFNNGSLGTNTFKNQSVSEFKIHNDIVTGFHFSNNSVTTNKIADKAVTMVQISNQEINISNIICSLKSFLHTLKGYYVTTNINQTFLPNSVILYYS